MSPRAITEDDLTQLLRNMEPKQLVSGAMHQRVVADSGDSKVSTMTRSPHRSKWEAAFASKLELEKMAGLIKAYWHEPFSLWLPGKVRYKPDFLVQYADQPGYHKDVMIEPRLELIEVKGWSKNRRDGITRLKIAAALFPCFVWRMVWMKKGGGFDGEYI